MSDLSHQFKEHDAKDTLRFKRLERMMEKHIEESKQVEKQMKEVLEKMEPLVETIQWLNSTGRFLVFARPIVLGLIAIAGLYIAVKKLFI